MSETKHTTAALIIAGMPIFQDAHGRYNLNLLHLASGIGEAKKPGNWIKRASTKALQEALESQVSFLTLETIHGGERSGTYAHEILAVEYAGWISPVFRIKVNQAFIDFRTGRLVPASPYLPPPSPPRHPGRERAEISPQLIAVWQTFRRVDEPLNSRELAVRSGVAYNTARQHAKYLLDLGLLDLYETFPRHLYQLAAQAEKRHAAYFQRLELIAAVLARRAQVH